MYQEITLLGNLGSEPELRETKTGKECCKFSLATSSSYKRNDEWVKETTWWRIIVWGDDAKRAADRLHKGAKCFIVGKMSPDPDTGNPRMWNKQDGTTAASYEVVADTVRFLSGKENEDIPF